MEDESIPNEHITASSKYNATYTAYQVRLNNEYGYWMKSDEDAAPWIQVKFSSLVTITAIQSQGYIDYQFWVQKLQIQTGYYEDKLSYITDSSGPAVSLRYLSIANQLMFLLVAYPFILSIFKSPTSII